MGDAGWRVGKALTAARAVRELSLGPDDLLSALLSLPPSRRLSILDSCGADRSSARYLIAGFDPFEIAEARGGRIILTRRGEDVESALAGDVLDLLDQRLAELSFPRDLSDHLPATGACIATFSYDLARSIEQLHANFPVPAPEEPDAVLAFYDTLVIHDYERGLTHALSVGGPRRLDETVEALHETRGSAVGSEASAAASSLISNLTRDEYIAAVGRIKEHIAAGDIYQANLTQRLSCALAQGLSPEGVFLRLRERHPAPFAAFIRRREDVVVSASPERFLRVEAQGDERIVEAWPIKGTRGRGRSAAEDARLREELLASEKDRAENVMIVDLMRNDLGRVCRYGSVEVGELCSLASHPTLFHLVSKVRGTLRDDVTAGDLMRAAFPCGSITGAPKIRAMQIIAENETTARGLSMGAIGYFSFDGRSDLSVAIRTMVVRESVARFNVGGGIVADSLAALEYEESLLKARALLHALGAQESTLP